MNIGNHPPARLVRHTRQRGVTLVELMVGIAVGLLVIAVAMSALMVSRGISGNVSDASGIQQQGSYILRVMGQQLRQAGSLFLNPNITRAANSEMILSPVAFEIKADAPEGSPAGTKGFDRTNTLVGGASSLTTGFRRFQEQVFFSKNATATAIGTGFLTRNCTGGPQDTSQDQLIESSFSISDNKLMCAGNGNTQPIARNVAQFQVNYIVQNLVGGTGTTMQYVKGADMPTSATDEQWRRAQAVQVCFVLFGDEAINVPDGTTYTDCDNASVDITTLTGPRKNRMHLLFRNTYQLRSQGLL